MTVDLPLSASIASIASCIVDFSDDFWPSSPLPPNDTTYGTIAAASATMMPTTMSISISVKPDSLFRTLSMTLLAIAFMSVTPCGNIAVLQPARLTQNRSLSHPTPPSKGHKDIVL